MLGLQKALGQAGGRQDSIGGAGAPQLGPVYSTPGLLFSRHAS